MEETNYQELVKKLRDEIKILNAEKTWYQHKMVEHMNQAKISGITIDSNMEVEYYKTQLIKYKKLAEFNSSPEFKEFLLFTKGMVVVVCAVIIMFVQYN